MGRGHYTETAQALTFAAGPIRVHFVTPLFLSVVLYEGNSTTDTN